MAIHAVLFDLDGTLHDRPAALEGFLPDQFARIPGDKGRVTAEEYRETFLKLDDTGRVSKDIVYPKLCEKLGFDPKLAGWLFEDYEDEFRRFCIGMPGYDRLLQALRARGHKLAVVTNGGGRIQNGTIEALGLRKMVDAVVISGEEEIRKPDPRLFQRALDRLRCHASESVFVGDNSIDDVEGAVAAGLRAVWIWNENFPEPRVEVPVIRELRQLLPVLSELYRSAR